MSILGGEGVSSTIGKKKKYERFLMARLSLSVYPNLFGCSLDNITAQSINSNTNIGFMQCLSLPYKSEFYRSFYYFEGENRRVG